MSSVVRVPACHPARVRLSVLVSSVQRAAPTRRPGFRPRGDELFRLGKRETGYDDLCLPPGPEARREKGRSQRAPALRVPEANLTHSRVPRPTRGRARERQLPDAVAVVERRLDALTSAGYGRRRARRSRRRCRPPATRRRERTPRSPRTATSLWPYKSGPVAECRGGRGRSRAGPCPRSTSREECAVGTERDREPHVALSSTAADARVAHPCGSLVSQSVTRPPSSTAARSSPSGEKASAEFTGLSRNPAAVEAIEAYGQRGRWTVWPGLQSANDAPSEAAKTVPLEGDGLRPRPP